MTRWWNVLLCVLMLVVQAFAQIDPKATISGTVIDASSQAGLPNVNVFLDGTTLGVASDDDGFFVIRNVPRGMFDLIFSMVGYERQLVKLQIVEIRDYEVTVKLKPAAIEIGTVEVMAKDPVEWRRNLERFQREFFGETRNAKLCAILNPEALDFRTQGDLFEVAFHVPIVVENRALGYKIDFLLEEFRTDGLTLQYSVKTKFEDLKPSSEEERGGWKESRQRAYAGSRRHFLAALARGTAYKEGFRMRLVESLRLRSRFQRLTQQLDSRDLLQPASYDFQRKLVFPDYLEVTYLLEPAEGAFRLAMNEQGQPLGEQVSWLQMNRLTVLFDTGGNLLEPFSLKSIGYWAFERTAELLPTDYVPE